jgi:peptidoglycan hydrolase CwlO-like protein
MCRIEDILYEAHKMGLKKKVFDRVTELRKKEKHKYTPLNEIYELAFDEVKNSEKNAKEIENEIKSLKNTLDVIQNDCQHKDYTIKYIQEVKSPKRVCDECNKDIGYATDKELKDSGFM